MELPSFTLLTGLNGSGKSQLLKAISEGVVQVETRKAVTESWLHVPSSEMAFFRSNQFVIDTNSSYEKFDNLSLRESAASFAEILFFEARKSWEAWAHERNIAAPRLRELTLLAHAKNTNHHIDRTSLGSDSEETLTELSEFLKMLEKSGPKISATISGSKESLVHHAANRLRFPHFLLTHADVIRGLSDPVPFFNASIPAIFSRYRDRRMMNWLLAKQLETTGKSDRRPLDNDEFELRYGRPPWEVLNETLARLGIDCQFREPDALSMQEYFPTLVSRDGSTFYPSDLSSGEQIILNLALVGYNATSNDATIKPKVVLLDEVDAPLHPAMAKTYLDVIQDVLVEEFGVAVIVTTHSPSTVALFPAQSIYLMKKGQPGIQPQEKSKALRDLLSGVPTLSVAVEDRRQVFAESPVEAENLDALYQVLRPSIKSPLSLQFIATGSKFENSGRDIVQRIVKNLDEAGNKTVLGLIDWDAKNKATERVKVLAEGRRYSLENVVMDPLVIAIATYRAQPGSAEKFGLFPNITFLDLLKLEPALCQKLADAVTFRVLGSSAENSTSCSYQGGLSLDIDVRYLKMNGHELEEKVVTAFPCFKGQQARGSGRLTAYLIEFVLKEMPEVIPTEVMTAFDELLGAALH